MYKKARVTIKRRNSLFNNFYDSWIEMYNGKKFTKPNRSFTEEDKETMIKKTEEYFRNMMAAGKLAYDENLTNCEFVFEGK